MKIARVMNRNYRRRILSEQQMKEYQKEYLEYAGEIITEVKSYAMGEVLLSKILAPFEYWLTDKFTAEDYQEAHPEVLKDKEEKKKVKVMGFSGIEDVKKQEGK